MSLITTMVMRLVIRLLLGALTVWLVGWQVEADRAERQNLSVAKSNVIFILGVNGSTGDLSRESCTPTV